MSRAHRWTLIVMTASLVAALSGCTTTTPPPLPTPVPAPLRPFALDDPAHCAAAAPDVPPELAVVLHTSGQAPEYVSINENVRFTADLSATVDTGARWSAILFYTYGAPGREQPASRSFAPPRPGDPVVPGLELNAFAGTLGDLTYRPESLRIFLQLGGDTAAEYDCRFDPEPQPFVIPLRLPADGSLQRVAMRTQFECRTTLGQTKHLTLGMDGVASARVAPGKQAWVWGVWRGFGSGNTAVLAVSGDGAARTTYVYAADGDPVTIPTPTAGRSGTMELRVQSVTGLAPPALKQTTPNYFTCTASATGSPLRIPVS